MFLQNGNRVFGVEPNTEMRQAAEKQLSGYATFSSVCGSAENTRLATGEIDFITAAQAFHWFEAGAARREFQRVLAKNGWVVLLWNDRIIEGDAFLEAYETFITEHSIDYGKVKHQNLQEDDLMRFFGNRDYHLMTIDNAQVLDFDGLKGRLLSASYIPAEDHPQFPVWSSALAFLFDQYQIAGRVTVVYKTKLYYGHLTE
jgi:SAM-dependent methyltransferase